MQMYGNFEGFRDLPIFYCALFGVGNITPQVAKGVSEAHHCPVNSHVFL